MHTYKKVPQGDFPPIYTVGYGDGEEWNPIEDCNTEQEAIEKVNQLNGGGKSKPSNSMKITTISFGLTKNLGNYQSSRLDISAEIEEGQDWKETLRQLKLLVADQIGGIHNDLTSISDYDLNLQGELKSLLGSIQSRRQEVESFKSELRNLDREVQELQQIKELFVDNSIQFFGLSKNGFLER